MQKITPINCPPLSCEIDEDTKILPASEGDLNLAQYVAKNSLECSPEGIYSDGEYYYYSIKMNFRYGRTSIFNDKTLEQQIWIRSTIKTTSGGRWEPDDHDEVLVDGDSGFRSLSDAVKQSALDGYKRELSETDNECHECYGGGYQFDDSECPICKGTGFIPKVLDFDKK